MRYVFLVFVLLQFDPFPLSISRYPLTKHNAIVKVILKQFVPLSWSSLFQFTAMSLYDIIFELEA